MGSSERTLSQDTIFDILSNPRRRYVLYHLRQEGEPVQLTTLAEHVAAWENETDVASLNDQQRKRVYVSLYQTHVPKLADAGIIEYDKEEGVVGLADDAGAIDDYLSQPDDEFGWQFVYAAEAAAGALVLALSVFDVAVFGLIPEAVVSLAVIAIFAVTATAQFAVHRQRQTVPPELRRR
jgi:hypothetical protein